MPGWAPRRLHNILLSAMSQARLNSVKLATCTVPSPDEGPLAPALCSHQVGLAREEATAEEATSLPALQAAARALKRRRMPASPWASFSM